MIISINEDHWINTDNITAIELRKEKEKDNWECVIVAEVQMDIKLTEEEAKILKSKLDNIDKVSNLLYCGDGS